MCHTYTTQTGVQKRLFGKKSLQDNERRGKKEMYPRDDLPLKFFFYPFYFSFLIWLKVLSTPAMLRAVHYVHIIIFCLVIKYFIYGNILSISQVSTGQDHEYLQLLLEEYYNIVLSLLRKPLSSLLISQIVNFIQFFRCIIQEGIFKLTCQDSLKLLP